MERIDAEKISGLLLAKGLKVRVFVEEKLESTNVEAMQMLSSHSLPFALFARSQTAGKGRLGRAWFSGGGSVCVSVAADIPFGARAAESFTVRAGIGICDALSSACGAELFIKWPNDIWSAAGEKLCGMLAEMRICPDGSRKIIFGVGLNYSLAGERIPGELKGRITDLLSLAKREITINEAAAEIVSAVVSAGHNMFSEDLASSFSRYDILKGKRISVSAGAEDFSGTADGVDDFGHLRVLIGDESVRLVSGGEASLKKNF